MSYILYINWANKKNVKFIPKVHIIIKLISTYHVKKYFGPVPPSGTTQLISWVGDFISHVLQ